MKRILFLFFVCFILKAQIFDPEDFYNGIFSNPEFYGKGLSQLKWVSPELYSYLSKDEDGKSVLKIFDAVGDSLFREIKIDNLINRGFGLSSIQNYELSSDLNFILLTETLKSRDIKSGGRFWVFRMETLEKVYESKTGEGQALIKLSPDSKSIGFVRDNDIYLIDLRNGEERRLTNCGTPELLNGIFDWVYEEEFSIIDGWRFSPDSKSIAFWQLDQNNVPRVKMPLWDEDSVYFHEYHYPVAGEPSSSVRIGMIDLKDGNTEWINLPKAYYIPRIAFSQNPDLLTIQALNRKQNELIFYVYDRKTLEVKELFREKSEGWIEISDDLRFVGDTEFIWKSDRNGYAHIYKYSLKGGEPVQLTSGNWEVDEIGAYNKYKDEIIFTSTEEGVTGRQVYKIKSNGNGKVKLTSGTGSNKILSEDDSDYFIIRHSSSEEMPSYSLIRSSDRMQKKLTFNEFPAEYKLQKPEFIKIPIEATELNASVLKPYDFNPKNKYPVLFYVYGGPGSQAVKDSWGGMLYLWHCYLAQKGYVIFTVDNRGTGFRGTDFRHSVYEKLGVLEPDDYEAAADYLVKLGFADSSRIGIWGWSYGGYITAMTLVKKPKKFKMGISVAPVTDWRFYDNIYTERYMNTPELNADGYRRASVLNYVSELNSHFLLVHGTSDDNVHFRNSILLNSSLIEHNKVFEFAVYPGNDHSISEGARHLFDKMKIFIFDKL